MKKNLFILLLSLVFCSSAFSESYYFKECKLSNAVLGSYIVNLEKNIIEVNLLSIDGKLQKFTDKIKKVEKDQIVSEKIKSVKGENIYYQYFLNSKSKSVIKLQYKKESGIDMEIFKLNNKKMSYCANIKADWDKNKIKKDEIKKEQKQILKAQEKIKKEQNALNKCKGNDHKQWTDCKGIYLAATGLKFTGFFKNGQIVKGVSVYPGGAKYVGEFKNFLPNGYGTFIWDNGDKYYGAWLSGKSHGDGTKIWKDGRKYSGKFENDKLHGEGTLFYPDGKKYVGDFLNGKRHGKGTLTYPDGTAYIGNFIAGKEQGLGECINQNGLTVACNKEIKKAKKIVSGKDTRNISIVAKKWVRISQFESNTKKGKKVMDKLKTDFEIKALELCSSKGNFKVLQKKIEVLEIDETPAYGLETKLKIGISGVVKCI